MVECRAFPLCGVVAESAVFRESGRDVVGVRGGVVVGEVATFASSIGPGVLAIDVAGGALRGGVAGSTVLRESGRDVVGIGGAVEVREVAAFAGGRSAPEDVVLMAGRALCGSVGAG